MQLAGQPSLQTAACRKGPQACRKTTTTIPAHAKPHRHTAMDTKHNRSPVYSRPMGVMTPPTQPITHSAATAHCCNASPAHYRHHISKHLVACKTSAISCLGTTQDHACTGPTQPLTLQQPTNRSPVYSRPMGVMVPPTQPITSGIYQGCWHR
jgi:hypothetical protein